MKTPAVDGASPEAANPMRRRIIQALGAAAVVPIPLELTAAPAAHGGTELKSPPRLDAIPLADVRLGAGPFLEAQRLDERYLLSLEPDRLLHNFHVNAGLPPKASVYGGWESQEPWVEIRCQGHTLGHYLSACALMYESTRNVQFKQRVDYIIDQLHACQQAAKSGLTCAFPDGPQQLINSVQGKEFAGVPWYTMHKILAGLRDAYLHAGNARALDVFTRLADALGSLTAPLSDAQLQAMLDREHGGMNEVFADLYALTGEAKFLDLSQRFSHRALLDPLAAGRDTLDGLHSNTQIPKVIGFQRVFEMTAREDYRRAAQFFWRTVVTGRSYATGGNGDIEHFFPPREFASRLQSAKTMETCCMHNMLRLTRALFVHEPSSAYADYYERTLYNGILASQDPESGMMTYFQATRPGYVKLYCKPVDSFWCCTGSGMENHAKYGDSIYFHDADSLYVNLFISSTVKWREHGAVITQSTRFPDEPRTQISLQLAKPAAFGLRIRHPAWCPNLGISINGERLSALERTKEGYVELRRRWRTGDRIEVSLPMQLHLQPLPTAPTIAALMYGPIVLAGKLGAEGLTHGADLIANERESGEMLNIPQALPTWTLNRDALGTQIRLDPTRPLTFIAQGIDGLPNLALAPYFRIAHERYNLYWKLA